MANLDAAQLATLKTDITVTNAATMWQGQTLLDWWNANEYVVISEYYNQEASPVVVLWRPDLTNDEISNVLVWTEVLTLSEIDISVFNLLLNGPETVVDATKATIRQGFSDIFSGPLRAVTLDNLTTLAQRNATYGEALYIGAISGGAYVSAIYGQPISGRNVREAQQLP